jgi:hypothetical protein
VKKNMANYKVLVPELSVPASIGELRDIYGNVIGHSHVNQTYFEGDVLSEDQVSPVVQEAVERGELDGRLEVVSEEPGPNLSARLREAENYADLSVDEVRSLFAVLPSDAIQAIKEYEAEYGQNRPEIVEYDIGRGEAFTDRLLGKVGSDHQDADEDKPVSDIVSREVGEDDFRFPETAGLGDGQPDREPGTTEDPDTTEKERAGGDGGKKASRRRSQRKSSSSDDDGDSGKPATPNASKDDDKE